MWIQKNVSKIPHRMKCTENELSLFIRQFSVDASSIRLHLGWLFVSLYSISIIINSITISAIHVKTITLHHIYLHHTVKWNKENGKYKLSFSPSLHFVFLVPFCLSKYGNGSHFSSLSEYFNWIKRALALWNSYTNENVRGRIYKFYRKKIENANGIEIRHKKIFVWIFSSSHSLAVFLCDVYNSVMQSGFLWVATAIWKL